MSRRRFYRSSATILATSLAAFVPKGQLQASTKKEFKSVKGAALSKSHTDDVVSAPPPPIPPANSAATVTHIAPVVSPAQSPAFPLTPLIPSPLGPITPLGPSEPLQSKPDPKEKFPWKRQIVTTTFWIGEKPTKNNPVPNLQSSWDPNWARNYGGTDYPNSGQRKGYLPVDFTPRQNPFYVALPYNDMQGGRHKPEAASVIPWFRAEYKGSDKSVLKGHWVAIRFGDKTAYAQWEDCGPFRTDHSAYVFGNERPKPNLNKGAGLDVSPAVRDYLGMNSTDVTDWKFVEFNEVPRGPWSTHGDNNTFVLRERIDNVRVAEGPRIGPDK